MNCVLSSIFAILTYVKIVILCNYLVYAWFLTIVKIGFNNGGLEGCRDLLKFIGGYDCRDFYVCYVAKRPFRLVVS